VKLFKVLSEYRWPIYLGSLLTMSVVSSGVIVWVATRPDTPRPMKGYYEAARAWDAGEAVEQASRQLGWSVRYELPSDVPHLAGMSRPVDVRVADRDGTPVAGLTGSLFAIRPSDTRLNQTADLVALPQAPGTYRTLVRLDAPGAWDVRIDMRQGALQFVHGARLTVPEEPAARKGEAR
jgi:nitrogen fixation protein FixH